MKHLTHYYYIMCGVAVALLASCDHERRATIGGTVAGGADRTVYLDHVSGSRLATVDSLRLPKSGKFAFRPAVEEGPDFFVLRLDGQSIPVVVDSLTPEVTVTADVASFATAYDITGEQNMRLQEASRRAAELRQGIAGAGRAVSDGELAAAAYADSVARMVERYKQDVLERYIYTDPSSPVAYYVLFQTVRGVPLFDPYDATDNRAFGAVATGWMFNYPQSPRVAHLEKVTREGQVLRLRQRRQQQLADSTLQTTVTEAKFFDLSLPDVNDHEVSLSSLVDGQSVVVLDFTAYYLPVSVQHNQMLAALHDKYASRGLKIYQVCLDPDENFWKVSASRVPWTSVRDRDVLYDREGYVQYSRPAGIYNVQDLPTVYVLGKDGSIEERVASDEELRRAVDRRLNR